MPRVWPDPRDPERSIPRFVVVCAFAVAYFAFAVALWEVGRLVWSLFV